MEELAYLYKSTPGCIQHGNYVLSSGVKSNYYIDSKQVSTSTRGLQLITSYLLTKLKEYDFKSIGGMSLGSDPITFAIVVSSPTPIHGFMIRKEVKGHGTGKRIEGVYKNPILVEDVTTTGGSLLEAARVLRENGENPTVAFTIVDRGYGANKLLAKEGITLYHILTAKDIGIEA